MKSTMTLLAVAAFAVSAGAQSATTQGAANATGSAQSGASQAGTSAAGSAEAAANAGHMSAAAVQATEVSAVLNKRIDSKNAKVGDEVMAKTTSEAKLANGTKIPKGSRLTGHVTEVEPKSHDNRNGLVAFAFDHAVLRDGQQIPVHVLMRAMAAPAPVDAGASMSDDMMGGGNAGMMAPGASAAPGGGGVVRNAGGPASGANGVLRGTTGMAADAGGTLGANAASGLDATAARARDSLGRDTTVVGGMAGSSTSFSGTVANLSGVMFTTVHASGDASASGASGAAGASTATLVTARGRNVSLDSGTQMTMAVAAQ